MIAYQSATQLLTIRGADPRDLDAVFRLHRTGVDDVPAGVFRPDDGDFFHDAIRRDCCVVADLGGQVMGYGVLVLPEPGSSSLADLVGAEQGTVAHVESAVIHRTMRGAGLHRALIAWRMARARAAGRHSILCTVSPQNAASLRNLMSEGFHIRALTQLYGGHSRYVLVQGPGFDLPDATSGDGVTVVDAANEQCCRNLLNDGWVGVASLRRRNCLQLVFVG